MKTPKVQVVCITYKHESVVAEALESFVRQKTNFPFEVLVGDDCSPDNTGKIVAEYAERYPDIVKVIPRAVNMGPTKNLMDLISHCTAPYIAFCEGDDYWIDDYKLQKQHDFMEANPDIRICFTKTEIKAPENWGISSYYRKIDGKIIVPDSLPNGKNFLKKNRFRSEDVILSFPLHTSSMFFRWRYNFIVPEWLYEGFTGDIPLFMMQLGEEEAAFLPEVTSVYRRSDVGIIMCYTQDELFYNTRKESIRWLSGLHTYFRENFNGYACTKITERIRIEAFNLLSASVNLAKFDEFSQALLKYPDTMCDVLRTYVNMYNDQKRMTQMYTWKGYLAVARDKESMKKLKNYVDNVINPSRSVQKNTKKRSWWKHYVTDKFLFDEFFYVRKYPDVRKSTITPRAHYFRYGWKEGRRPYPEGTRFLKKLQEWLYFWMGAFVPKKKNRWVFSSFSKKGYIDNTKYMYEYVVKHHPEIEAMWLTMDLAVYSQLKEAGLPVRLMKKSRWYMMRAALAFTDHYVRADYENKYGYNNRTKVVQLWHGVGLKSMKPTGDKIPSTTVPGVRLSSDLFPMPGDGVFTKFKKKIRYIFKAPFRELHEKYFGFLCPGQEHVKYLVDIWRVPRKACIFSGQPREINLHASSVPQRNKILYAPTFRWDPKDEKEMINSFISSLPQIGEFLDSIDGELVLRLHPHTWRNYEKMIQDGIKGYGRISKDAKKDIYTNLGEYSIMISDYSSIAFDFVLMNRPIVFFVPDREKFMRKDVVFNYPFDEFTPGPKVNTWQDVIAALQEYVETPHKDDEWRRTVQAEFYDMQVNDADNSKRIVEELKKRLNIK